jgi:hypothetical protein
MAGAIVPLFPIEYKREALDVRWFSRCALSRRLHSFQALTVITKPPSRGQYSSFENSCAPFSARQRLSVRTSVRIRPRCDVPQS